MRKNYRKDELLDLVGTLEVRANTLDRWRDDPTAVSSRERQAVWVILSEITMAKARHHYNRKQRRGKMVHGRQRDWFELTSAANLVDDQDRHIARVAALGAFMLQRRDKSVAWCVSAYKLRFAQFEAKAEIEAAGLGAPTSEQAQVCNDLIKIRKVYRSLRTSDVLALSKELRARWPKRFRSLESAVKVVLHFQQYLALSDPVELDSLPMEVV